MPQTEFERINLQRAYPFIDNDADCFYGIVADLQLTIRPLGRYIHGQHRVYLQSLGPLSVTQAMLLDVVGKTQFIALFSDAPGLRNSIMLFAFGATRRYEEILGIAVSASRFVDVVLGISPGNSTPPQPVSPAWQGHLVIGNASDIPGSLTILNPPLPVEPARIINAAETATTRGRTFVYNQIATQYTQPAGCEQGNTDLVFASGEYVLACGPIEGEFRLAGGYQTRLAQDTTRRQLTVSADKTAGEQGRSCSPIAPAGEIDDTDNSPRCDEVLRSINGIGGPSIQITALESVQIGLYPDQHRIIIAPTGIDAATCPEERVADPVEYLPVNDLAVPCGDLGEPLPAPPGPPDTGVGYEVGEEPTASPTTSPPSTMCRWVADDDTVWVLDHYPCGSPHSCSFPASSAGSPGQIATTLCMTQADEFGTLILNPYFFDAVSLGSWNTTGDVRIVGTDFTLPSDVLPVAKLDGGVTSASLSQRSILLPSAGSYLLQFGCRVSQGAAELAIGTEFGFHLATRISLTDDDYAGWQDVEVGPLLFTSGPLRLVIVAGPGSIIEISQFALVKQ